MKKNPRIKILVALFSSAVTIVAAVLCTVSVLAIPNDSVLAIFASNLESVNAEVWASYQIEGQEKIDLVSTNNSNKIVLNDKSASAGFVTPKEFSLTSSAKSITFAYTFANTGNKEMKVNLTLPEVIENFIVKETNNGNIINNHTIIVGANEIQTYEINITIDNIARDSRFSGTFNFTMTSIF